MVLDQYRIPIIKIRWSDDHLVFIIEITISAMTVFILKWDAGFYNHLDLHNSISYTGKMASVEYIPKIMQTVQALLYFFVVW